MANIPTVEDAEIFAKDQSLRREETSKRSLSECQDHAAEFKEQTEDEISQLRKEVVHIWGAFQKTHVLRLLTDAFILVMKFSEVIIYKLYIIY